MKNESTRKIINVDKCNYSPIWTYKQEDDGVLKLALFKGSTLLDITGQTIKLGAKRPDNSIIELTNGFKINKNELDIILKNNILAIPGIVECDLEITDAGGKMTTASFYLTINKKITGKDNLDASNDISAINKIVAEVLAIGKELDGNIKVVVEEANKKITAIDTALNKKLNEMQEDYDSLQKIMIDENQAANLQAQINKSNEQLDNKANKSEVVVKADKSYVDTRLQSLASGSPKGVYATVSALTTAFPTGNSNIYIISADGGWYYWNSTAWTKGGTYQASSFSDYKKALTSSDNIDDYRSEGTYLVDTKVVKGTFPTTSQYCLLENVGSGNFIRQTLTVILKGNYDTTSYARTWNNGWSKWTDLTSLKVNNNVMVVCNTSYNNSDAMLDVVFNEETKTLTFPRGTCIITGNVNTILNEDVILNIDNTLTLRQMILYNTTTKSLYLKYISASGHVPNGDDVMLGSFLSEVKKNLHTYKSIQGCFSYKLISREENNNNVIIQDINKNIWHGKKINVIGDSIVYGSYGNFVNVIKDILSLSVARNYGIGGCCLAKETNEDYNSKHTPVVSRYMEMDDDADIIVMAVGTNDASHQIPLGNSTSTSEYEFNGALNIVLDGLRKKYPDKLIIVTSILHRFNDNSLNVNQYRQAIEERCNSKHIVFYDSYKYTGFDFAKGYYDKILTTDGLHPNQKGADILGRKLAGFINWQ